MRTAFFPRAKIFARALIMSEKTNPQVVRDRSGLFGLLSI